MVKNKLLCLFISVIITTGGGFLILTLDKPQFLDIDSSQISSCGISENVTKFAFAVNVAPVYFGSAGNIYVAIASTYSPYWKEFVLEMSLDDLSWKNVTTGVNLPQVKKEELYEFTPLGPVNLNQVKIPLYGKCYIP